MHRSESGRNKRIKRVCEHRKYLLTMLGRSCRRSCNCMQLLAQLQLLSTTVNAISSHHTIATVSATAYTCLTTAYNYNCMHFEPLIHLFSIMCICATKSNSDWLIIRIMTKQVHSFTCPIYSRSKLFVMADTDFYLVIKFACSWFGQKWDSTWQDWFLN